MYEKKEYKDELNQNTIEYNIENVSIDTMDDAIEFITTSQEEIDTRHNYVLNGICFVGLDLINELKNIQEI